MQLSDQSQRILCMANDGLAHSNKDALVTQLQPVYVLYCSIEACNASCYMTSISVLVCA